ncbi:O-antigen ligase family protein [Litorivicinus sp.]|nr:O-antigen ligase family protein [Litorivicinus sp.]
MTTVDQPCWLRFSERAFSFNFIAFSFVMFSCWFPTGFSASFSTFAFLFALPLFFSLVDWARISLFEKAGLVLFAWLLLSVFWSEATVLDSLVYLSEYRLYFMLPIFATALLYLPKTQKWALYAAVLGATVALITSYGLGLGWWKIEGAHLSLANRIYHGFIMSALLLIALLVARNSSGVFRVAALVIAILTAYNVLNIETGRTGYLQIIAVSFIFVVLNFSRLQASVLALVTAFGFVAAYVSLDQFNTRVDQTLTNLEQLMVNDDYHSSAGHRLEFYRGAIQIGADNPVGGVGVGDVVAELESRANSGQIRVLTDNVHSEFMNMLIAGGVPALLLFSAFVVLIAWVGFQYRKSNRAVGDALIGISIIVFVSALFNSTIKDYGEKHALLIMLSLLAAKLLADRLGSITKAATSTPP